MARALGSQEAGCEGGQLSWERWKDQHLDPICIALGWPGEGHGERCSRRRASALDHIVKWVLLGQVSGPEPCETLQDGSRDSECLFLEGTHWCRTVLAPGGYGPQCGGSWDGPSRRHFQGTASCQADCFGTRQPGRCLASPDRGWRQSTQEFPAHPG